MNELTLADVFKSYRIFNPRKWLARQRALKYPRIMEWGGELFDLPDFEKNLGLSALDAVMECGIPFTEVEQMKSKAAQLVLSGLMNGPMQLFEISSVDSLLIIDARQEPKQAALLCTGDIEEYTFTDCAFALLESWERNTDRAKAYKARAYLCDTVERLLAATT